jgi:chemotaxis protein CheX
MFDLDVINAFSKSAVSILTKSCHIKVRSGKIRVFENINHIGGVIAFLGITGTLNGRIILNMKKETSFKVASELNNETIDTLDDIYIATIKEVTNLISGSAINILSREHIDLNMTTPAILISENLFMFEKNEDKILSICYDTDYGNIHLHIILFNS